MGLTISSTVDSLNIHTREYNTVLQQTLRTGLEFESMLPVRATDKMYVAPSASITNVVQPYQWQFTPAGTTSFSGVENTLQPIKIDILITEEDLEKFWDAWRVEWFESGKAPDQWTFPRYLYDTVYVPKIQEELNAMAWSGEYAAPTAGTAGASLTSVDGYKTKIEEAITASLLTEYTTGTLVANTMVNQVEGWIDTFPVNYRDEPGVVMMSPTNARYFWRNYREEFGAAVGSDSNTNNELRIDATNKTIMPVRAMEGSNRFIFYPTRTNNMIWGTRRGYSTMPTINWENHERSIKGMATIYRFYGFEYWGHVFVNDQD